MSDESGREYTFTWRIENYSSCYQKINEFIKSPEFTAEIVDESKWYLQLFPRGSRGYEKYISCYLGRVKNDKEADKITLTYSIEAIGVSGKILGFNRLENREFVGNASWGWNNFVKADQLIPEMKNCIEDTLILRCRLKRKKPILKTVTGCEARTKIGVDRCSFKWNVSYPDSTDWSVSKILPFPETSQIKITLTAPADALVITVGKTKEHMPPARYVTCRMSLLDVKGTERVTRSETHLFETKDDHDSWEFPAFIFKSKLDAEKESFLKNGMFTVTCQVSASSGIELELIERKMYDPSSTENPFPMVDTTISVLQDDLRRMFSNKKHTDVKLLAGDDMVPAHKSVLSARSPVFSAMFEMDKAECSTDGIRVSDMDGETLKSFLGFMYSGTVDNMDYECASKLLIAADKYQVESLKEKCASFLMSSLSDGNVWEVLVNADKVGHKLLKSSALDYIKTHAETVLCDLDWSQCILKSIK